MRFEMIREIFNKCSNNQMRDVFVSEVEAPTPDAAAAPYITGSNIEWDCTDMHDGTWIYDIMCEGTKQRLTLTEI